MNLEFFIRLREMVSSGLVKMVSNAQRTTASIQSANSQIIQSYDQVKSKVKEVDQLQNRQRGGFGNLLSNPLRAVQSWGRGFSAALQRGTLSAFNFVRNIRLGNGSLTQSYDSISRKIRELESTIQRSTSIQHIRSARRELEQLQRQARFAPGNMAGGGFGGSMLGGLLPALGFAGAMALGGNVLTSGLQAQARATSFEVMAGKEQGTTLNRDLTKFAQDSIYGNEVYQNAQTMMGFGINVKDVMPDLKMLGDIAMGDKDKLGRLTLAFSQVKAAGKLMGQDLLQFVNAGFNPLQVMSEKTGLSIGQLREKMSEGVITFEMVHDAFKTATSEGGRFFDMTNKIAQTDFGKWEAFKGQMAGLAMQVGGMLAPVLGNLITNYLAPFVQWLSQAATWIQSNWNWIGLLVTVLGSAVVAYKTVVLVTNLWAAAQALLNMAMKLNPIGLVIAAIAGLVAGIVYAWNKFEGFRKVVWGLWETFKQAFSNIGGFFKLIFAPIAEAIDAFKENRWGDMAKAVGKFAYNISPVGLIDNAIAYGRDGGFSKGMAEAWQAGQERGKGAAAIQEAKETVATNAPAKVNSFASLDAEETAKGIAGGGPRVINVHINKMVEKIEIHSQNLTEGMDDVRREVEETFLRILNSGAAVQ